MVASLTTRTIDLLAVDAREPSTYDDLLVVLARDRFRDQLAKGGLEPTVIAAATLDVTKGEARSERVGDVIVDGHLVSFTAKATTDSGLSFEASETVFVASHDPDRERRSARANGPAVPTGEVRLDALALAVDRAK